MIGINAAGLASKLDTFDYALKSLKAKLFFVQEVKQQNIGNISTDYLKNFQLFELVRKEQRVSGGGLMIGVDKELKALQVRQGDDEVECLSVVVSVGGTDIRAVCGYGPQSRDTAARKSLFWEYLDTEVELAETNKQILVIQLDSNCYAGSRIIPNDPNSQNKNGKYLSQFLERNQTLTIVNSLPLCDGIITRQRKTTLQDEKAILDLFIVCDKTLPYIKSMKVDEIGEFRLTNFHGFRKGQNITFSDHNMLSLKCQFDQKETKPQRIEMFNFKNPDGQDRFKEMTTYSRQLTECFEDNSPFEKQSQNWYRRLNKLFQLCFTKIRHRKRKQEETEVEILLEQRKKLRRESQKDTNHDYQQDISRLEEEIRRITSWEDATHMWDMFQQVADSDNPTSTQAMWKWKKKLFPKIKHSSPMGVKDKKGDVKTKSSDIKRVFEEEYKHRLRARPILPEIQDIEMIQDQLFQKRLESASKITTPPWTMVELEKVLSSLKSGKARDPSGLVCDIFKSPICGMDLKMSLLTLVNKIKETLTVPKFVCNSNISSIWKKKGDVLKLEYHRGLFLVSLFKTIIMKLLYLRNYETIDANMSESNAGGRKGRNCRDHIFVVNGAIQDALSSKSSKGLDLFICDYRTMFDGLDIKTTLNDLYDNGVKDDYFSLVYKLYENSHISIKTPVGLTERRRVEREIITQGDCLGPILASSTVDTFGKESYEKQKHLYYYRNKTPVSMLSMLDDVFALSTCGPASIQMQEYINIKSGSKKLQLARDKTFRMHIGKKNPTFQCEESYIDCWETDQTKPTEKHLGKVKV